MIQCHLETSLPRGPNLHHTSVFGASTPKECVCVCVSHSKTTVNNRFVSHVEAAYKLSRKCIWSCLLSWVLKALRNRMALLDEKALVPKAQRVSSIPSD